MTTAQPVIRAEQLKKTFGPVRALDGLDLEVAPGEVHGFLGPNGAGKSTTIRVVLDLISAIAGTAQPQPEHQPVTNQHAPERNPRRRLTHPPSLEPTATRTGLTAT
jgi:ABC-type multidrug transport system ATPase subunit